MKKKNKLTIKENWTKALTLSSNELLRIKKGGVATKDGNPCTGCKGNANTLESGDFACETEN